jgi:hypothetical protein
MAMFNFTPGDNALFEKRRKVVHAAESAFYAFAQGPETFDKPGDAFRQLVAAVQEFTGSTKQEDLYRHFDELPAPADDSAA